MRRVVFVCVHVCVSRTHSKGYFKRPLYFSTIFSSTPRDTTVLTLSMDSTAVFPLSSNSFLFLALRPAVCLSVRKPMATRTGEQKTRTSVSSQEEAKAMVTAVTKPAAICRRTPRRSPVPCVWYMYKHVCVYVGTTHPLHFRGVCSQSCSQGSSRVPVVVKPANLLSQHGLKCFESNPLCQLLSCHSQS